MRIIHAIWLTILTFSGAFSQIPNFSFENWKSESTFELSSFSAQGLVSRSTDASDGNYSLKIENNPFEEVKIGLVTNGFVGTSISGGVPYTDIPLVMSFDVKMDLTIGDEGKLVVIFKKLGQEIGYVDFSLSGSTSDTFKTFKVPIQWISSIAPDSMVLLAISNNPDEGDPNGEGYIILDNINFETFGTLNQKIPNNSFESWTETQTPIPSDWLTSDQLVKESYNLSLPEKLVTRSDESAVGSHSILLQNKRNGSLILPAFIFSENKERVVDNNAAFPISTAYKFLNVSYKYKPTNGDSAFFYVILSLKGNPIAVGTQSFGKASGDAFERLNIPLTYFVPTTPDSAFIIISAANLTLPKGENTKLWIDNLVFSSDLAQLHELPKKSFSFYPNPANTSLTVRSQEQFSAVIRDIHGKTFWKSELSTNNEKIDVSEVPQGMYFLQIHYNNRIETTKISVIH